MKATLHKGDRVKISQFAFERYVFRRGEWNYGTSAGTRRFNWETRCGVVTDVARNGTPSVQWDGNKGSSPINPDFVEPVS